MEGGNNPGCIPDLLPVTWSHCPSSHMMCTQGQHGVALRVACGMDDKGTSRGATLHWHIPMWEHWVQGSTQHMLHPRAHPHPTAKMSSGFGMTPNPCQLLAVLHPHTLLQLLPGPLCHGKEVFAGSALLPLLDWSSGPPSEASPVRSCCPSLLAKAWDGGYRRAPAP